MNFVLNSLLPLVGGLVIFASFAGWGFLVRGILGARQDCPVAEAVAVGLGAIVLIGGLLNLLEAVTLAAVVVLEAIGLAALATRAAPLWRRARDWFRDPALLMILAVLLLYYLRSVSNVIFEPGDDLNGYLLPVEKLIQTGELGDDPFLDRRLFGGLGSYFFLEAIFVFQFGYHHISILEPGFGLLMAVLSAVDYVRREPVPRTLIVATAIGSTAALCVVATTATAAVFQAGLLIVLVFKLLSDRVRGVADAVSLGLMIGSVLSFKIQVLPFVGVLMLAWLAAQAWRHRDLPALMGTAAGAALVSLALLAPWMIALHHSSATFLFPLLGIGYHGAAYGTIALPSDGLTWPGLLSGLLLTKRPLLALFLIVGSIIAVYWSRPRRSAADDLMAILAILVVPLVLLVFAVTGGGAAGHGYRYAHSTYAAVAVPGFAWLARRLFASGANSSVVKVSAASAVIIFAGCLLPPSSVMLGYFAQVSYINLVYLVTGNTDLAFRLSKTVYWPNASLSDAEDSARLARAQQTTKRRATVLADLQRPYLLDFKRNVVWSVGDCPAGSSPPPGFPIDGSAQEVAGYLRGAGVDYIIFQYQGPQPWFDIQLREFQQGFYRESRWVEDCVRAAVKFQAALRELMASQPLTYRDDRFAVIALSAAASD